MSRVQTVGVAAGRPSAIKVAIIVGGEMTTGALARDPLSWGIDIQ